MSRAESWSFWTGVWAVGLTAAAALAGVVSWYFSIQVSEETGERTRIMELKISEQQERAAKAEKDLLALQTKLSPRVLTPEQQERIVAKVKSFAGLPFEVMTYPGDAEPAALARTITSVLTAAGWELRPVKGTLLGSATGLVVTVTPDADVMQREAAATLVSALNSEGIAASQAVGALRVGVTIKIQVAKKP